MPLEYPSLLTCMNRLRLLPTPTTVSSLSSAVVETATVETAEDEAVVVAAASVAMASAAADVAEAEVVAVPAATLPRRRPRGGASVTCGGGED